MSNRYRITFNLTTDSREAAYIALSEVARAIDEKCIVEDSRVDRHKPVYTGRVVFLAANDAEAADLVQRTQGLTGLPPMDAVGYRLVQRSVTNR